MKLLVRWAVASLALLAAAWLVPGIHVDGTAWFVYALMAIVLGLANAIVRPFLKLLTCPLIILTLGVFVLIINGVTLWLSAQLANWLGIGFYVDSFGAAFLGGIIVSIVTIILSALLKEDDEEKHRQGRNHGN